MDIEDLITECNGPTAANTSDLSPGVVEAVERSDRDADVSHLGRNVQHHNGDSTYTPSG
jgi:hypothetical protein